MPAKWVDCSKVFVMFQQLTGILAIVCDDPGTTTDPKPNVVKEARQRQLIDATISTIGRVGYSGTTLNHVAGAAGLSTRESSTSTLRARTSSWPPRWRSWRRRHESLWLAKIAAAGGSPEGGLDAMIEADFDPFDLHPRQGGGGSLLRRGAIAPALPQRGVGAGGAVLPADPRLLRRADRAGRLCRCRPADVARGLNAISDGLWADLLVLPETFDVEAAKRICRTFLPPCSRSHFPRTGGPANDTLPAERLLQASTAAAPSRTAPESAAPRPGWQRRCKGGWFPETTLQPPIGANGRSRSAVDA